MGRRWVSYAILVGSALLVALLGTVNGIPGLPLWLIVVLTVAGVIANLVKDVVWGRLGDRINRDLSARDAARSGFVTARSGRRLPKVRESTALECGVHRAAGVADGASPSTPVPASLAEVPSYVPRDCDDRLDRTLRDGGLVVIEGRSAAGKTRTAFEAMRRVMPKYRLLVPKERDARALHALADLNRPLRRSVVWLDDFERYLGPDGITERTLDALRPPGRSDVVLLATLRSEALRAIRPTETDATTRSSPGRTELVLRRATVIRLADRFSAAERTRALTYRSDPRLAAALDQDAIGLPEYLAAGPAVLLRWVRARDGEHPLAAALISAAVDCRRIGYHNPVPAHLLAGLVPAYLDGSPADRDRTPDRDDNSVHDDEVGDAYGWARERVLGATGCLTATRDGRYLAFDYLVDQVQRDVDASAVPVAVWDAVIPLLSGSDPALLGIATTANSQGHLDRAGRAWRNAAEAGNRVAMYYTAVLATNRDEDTEACRWYQSADETDDPMELRELGDAAQRAKDRYWRRRWWARAAEGGDREAMYRLFLDWKPPKRRASPTLARPTGHSDDVALFWVDRAARAGHPAAMYRFSVFLRNAERSEEAESWLRRATAVDEPAAFLELGRAARNANDHNNAIRWLRRAAEHGDGDAMMELAETYRDRHESPWRETGDLEATEQWYRAAGEAGHRIAMFNLAGLLSERDNEPEVEYWWLRCAQLGDHNAMYDLGEIRWQRGDLDAARTWWRRAAARGNRVSLIRLASLADERGDAAEAERWDRQLIGPRSARLDRESLRQAREATSLRLNWRNLMAAGGVAPEPFDAPVLRRPHRCVNGSPHQPKVIERTI